MKRADAFYADLTIAKVYIPILLEVIIKPVVVDVVVGFFY